MLDPAPRLSTGEAVRDHLIHALAADLVGPFSGDPAATEVLQLPPSRWYLTGFLAPETGRIVDDPTEDDELGAGDDEEGDDAGFSEPMPKQRKIFPASLGLSVLLPAGAGDRVTATLRWAEYTEDKVEIDPERDGPDRKAKKVKVWVRQPRGPTPTEVRGRATTFRPQSRPRPGRWPVRSSRRSERYPL